MSHTVKPRALRRGNVFLILGVLALAGVALAIHLDSKAKAAALAEHCAAPEMGTFSTKLACIARPSER